MLLLVALGIVTGIYVLGLLVLTRRVAMSELFNRTYPPYDLGDYAGAGLWGLLIGAFWPVLAVAVFFGAAIGWAITRRIRVQ